MAQISARLLGAGRVIAIERLPERLHAHSYLPRLLACAGGPLSTAFLAAHRMPLEQAVRGYEMSKKKEDGCVRAVFEAA